MARWKLTEPHYLKVAGTRWEYSEVDRITGKPKRTMFDVPLYLDPRDPTDWNVKHSPDEGEIVVSNGNNPGPRDVIFSGPPTPGMYPLDDEAQEISSKYDWTPTQGLDDESQMSSHTSKILNGLMDKMFEVQANVGVASQVLKIEGMDQMMAAMAKMMEQNQLLLSQVLKEQVHRAEAPQGKRVLA